MAWTAPRSWVTSEVPTASTFNTHIRDNFSETEAAKVTAAGGTLWATGANALTELAKGASVTWLKMNGAASAQEWTTKAPAAGFLLGRTIYDPASDTTYNSSSATYADVDATNLKVDFKVPASGKVLIALTAYAIVPTTATIGFNLRESSTDLAETNQTVLAGGAAVALDEARLRVVARVTGLTAGDAKTYKWGFARLSGSGTVSIKLGSTNEYGPGVMEVYSAP